MEKGGGEGRPISIPFRRGSRILSPLHATEVCTISANSGHLAPEEFSLVVLFFPGCEEELEGLTQDWISLNKCRAELSSRKRDLEIL